MRKSVWWKRWLDSAAIGTLAITVLSNALNVLQISGYLQQIILGAVFIIAVAPDKG
ncbi:hypothetical protein L1889_15575 [Paenalcaligenes niemegkensis]|uniref:hypothetical protein n=1 Tax=Paenalcaligenes niemegkensis TaxID=2895469 RepID=UPI001EE85EA8|nr:hypothetical protein [Paenalcaligenes niemegkensis]MCQ9617914.1 hypothetical protein [Paenalcaligenes niemegkensis]